MPPFTLDEVDEAIKTLKEVARRELERALRKRSFAQKRRTRFPRYQVNPHFEHLAALNIFIRETTNVRPQVIVAALRRAGTLQLVALSGFFTGVLESKSTSSLWATILKNALSRSAVHSLEAELGREIRYASFATADFRYRFGRL